MDKNDLNRLELLHDNVLVMPLDPEPNRHGIILRPEDHVEKTILVRVVLTGPGYLDEPVTVTAGHVVCIRRHGGREIEVDMLDGEGPVKLLLVRHSAIEALIEWHEAELKSQP